MDISSFLTKRQSREVLSIAVLFFIVDQFVKLEINAIDEFDV